MILAICLKNLGFMNTPERSGVSVGLCKTTELVDYFILDMRFLANVKE